MAIQIREGDSHSYLCSPVGAYEPGSSHAPHMLGMRTTLPDLNGLGQDGLKAIILAKQEQHWESAHAIRFAAKNLAACNCT